MQMKLNGRQLTVPPSATSIGFLLGPAGYRPLPLKLLIRALAGRLVAVADVFDAPTPARTNQPGRSRRP